MVLALDPVSLSHSQQHYALSIFHPSYEYHVQNLCSSIVHCYLWTFVVEPAHVAEAQGVIVTLTVAVSHCCCCLAPWSLSCLRLRRRHTSHSHSHSLQRPLHIDTSYPRVTRGVRRELGEKQAAISNGRNELPCNTVCHAAAAQRVHCLIVWQTTGEREPRQIAVLDLVSVGGGCGRLGEDRLQRELEAGTLRKSALVARVIGTAYVRMN